MTMKCFAVVFVDFSSNDPEIEIIYAENWRQAATQHTQSCFCTYEDSGTKDDNDQTVYNKIPQINEVPETIEEAKMKAFDSDHLFEIKELGYKDPVHGSNRVEIFVLEMDELSPIPGAGAPDPNYEAIEGLDEDPDESDEHEEVHGLPGSIDNPQNFRN